jgi:hypothetical protein
MSPAMGLAPMRRSRRAEALEAVNGDKGRLLGEVVEVDNVLAPLRMADGDNALAPGLETCTMGQSESQKAEICIIFSGFY